MAYRDDREALSDQVEALRRRVSRAEQDAAAEQKRRLELERRLEAQARSPIVVGDAAPSRPRPAIFALLALSSVAVIGGSYYLALPTTRPLPIAPVPAGAWWQRVRPHCNPVEVNVTLQHDPPGPKAEDRARAAACYALAGELVRARQLLDGMGRDRPQALSVLFETIHPVADAGDDTAAGPGMELVLDYWPENYMALFHAGMAEYIADDPTRARDRLTRFLGLYKSDDGWTRRAREALERIARGQKAPPDLHNAP